MITRHSSFGARLRGLLPLLVALLLALPVPAAAQRARPRERQEARQATRDVFQEQRDEIVQFVRQHFPEKARLLEDLRKRNPAEFQRRRQKLAEEVRRLMELERENPGLFKLQVEEMRLRDELNRLARDLRRQREGSRERQESAKQLRDSLERSFDLRQKIKQGELEDLRQRLGELESSLKRRTERRAQLIEERFQQLSESGEEDW
ncbi:MAG: hypothetical protein WC326_14150 [Candidatus Delongbacteria bacterium]